MAKGAGRADFAGGESGGGGVWGGEGLLFDKILKIG